MANVVIYIRVSTKEQLQGGSLATQLRACMDYSERYGYEVISVFQEEGESAKTADRSELQRMLVYCAEHRGEVEGVVVYSVDRFSRNVEDFITLSGDLRKLGIQLFLATQEFDDTPEGKLNRNMQAVFAQYDNDRRSARTTEGMVDAVKAGRWLWVAPIGYLNGWVGGEKNIVQDTSDPLRVPLIQEAWRLIDAGYTEVEALCIVNGKGLTQQDGRKVSKQNFSKMLRNKLYMGVIEAFEMTVKSDAIEAIIDEALWWRVYERLEGKKVSPTRHKAANPLYPLRRLLTCPHGHKLTASASKGGSGIQHAYYHCVSCGKGGKRYRAEDVHRAFGDYLGTLSFDDDLSDALREAVHLGYLERNETAEKERKRLNKELAEVEQSISVAMDKLMMGVLTDDQAKEYLAVREQKRREIRRRLSGLGTVASNVEQIWNFGLSVLSDLGGTWQNIKNIDVKQRFQRWIFPEGLTYDGKEFGTRRIACSLRVKQAKNADESPVVPPARFERAAPALGERCSVP